MQNEPLPRNLAFLCSYHSSIAAVCRRLGINRQQFNKYLSGQSWPSRRNMRRICDFFGVSEDELLMEHRHFAEIVGLKHRLPIAHASSEILAHIEDLYRGSGDLGRYVGYYFRYFYSFGHAGKIIRGLVAIYEKNGRYYWRSIERLRSNGRYGVEISKCSGTVLLLGDRIFVLEYETLLKSSITQVILYQSYRTSPTYLIGIQTGMPLLRGRKPAASIVLLEYLGQSIDHRKALNSCGLFDDTDAAIDASIRSMIVNRIEPERFVLETEDA
ncbi:helix-turn-helix transcriptional regulator [Kaustia mangrovi]|uniref:Helix-turn-helix transcriptional regulator n=1 Tax=Kaustia mangrovi TaxID=2593653 RepID=A0A7S8C1N3_9HYPH|nr:helix-turn-helix transcriptional regulator [Kaustia mangrovi]QPC41734.1 helix-turn-helix transcriptional regulator [Kaustia mangrovi]